MFATNAIFIVFLHLFAIHILRAACSYNNLDSVKIIYYYGPSYNDHKEYDLKSLVSILQHPKFIHNKTTCYMPGWLNKKHGADTRLLVDSYFKRNTTNFLKLHWEELSIARYISAKQNVIKLSTRVADSIIELFKAGLDQNSFSLVGLSMGARGVSVIGQNVFERSNGSMLISRITPLDPSNEEADDAFVLPPIKKSDAKFVDVIHSAAGGLVTTTSFGHANFWPNNGTALQPGCPNNDTNTALQICNPDNLLTMINGFYCKKDECSHLKALAYWAESVSNPNLNTMLAFSSDSYNNLLENGAENYMETAVLMGIDCPSSARGDYFLQYNSSYGFKWNFGTHKNMLT